MDTGRISVRYAKAAYEYALEKGEETRLYEEMKVLARSFSSFPVMRKVMEDPTVLPEEKLKILITASGIQVSHALKCLLDLVVLRKREGYMQFIALMYQEYYRKKKGIVITKLTTTEPITPEAEAQLKAIVARGESAQVDLIKQQDASIIGGFVLEVDYMRLDASIRNQLSQLKQKLIKEK